jgi:histidyl-tRNA synthetase
MQDLLPEQQRAHRRVEDEARALFHEYGYEEVSLPLLEQTGLFQRAVGESTDIVEKQMYSFQDKGGDSVTLRPEGTAGCVRMASAGGLLFNQARRLWYCGPMFRYERPQKGRYRQFHQIGAECFGMAGPAIDAELIAISARLWQRLGLQDAVTLELSTLGGSASRARFRSALVAHLEDRRDELDPDSQRRLATNPLRILDSKEECTRRVLEGAPNLHDYLDDDARGHFDGLRALLDAAGIGYRVNSSIVRGLDYYGGTVFEWTTPWLGAQSAVCGGGRYDALVEMLGGRQTPAIGFGVGVDRVALLLLERRLVNAAGVQVYVVVVGAAAQALGFAVAERLRDLPQRPRVLLDCVGGRIGNQLRRADQSGARIALILGEDEAQRREVTVKPLRGGEQRRIGVDRLHEELPVMLGD